MVSSALYRYFPSRDAAPQDTVGPANRPVAVLAGIVADAAAAGRSASVAAWYDWQLRSMASYRGLMALGEHA